MAYAPIARGMSLVGPGVLAGGILGHWMFGYRGAALFAAIGLAAALAVRHLSVGVGGTLGTMQLAVAILLCLTVAVGGRRPLPGASAA